MSNCIYSVTLSQRGGSPFDIRLVDCGRNTVPCPKCGKDSELCTEHITDGTCFECEFDAAYPQMNLEAL